MKISHISNLLTLTFFCFYVIECRLKLDLKSFYQITTFTSDNFIEISGLKKSPFHGYPVLQYSFNESHQNLLFPRKNLFKHYYSLQESLIIYRTSNLNQTEAFINFLGPHLTVRQRPKCLIDYSSNVNEEQDREEIIDALKYAWKNKFLDITIMVTNLEKPQDGQSVLTYQYNPFNDIVYKKESAEEIEKIFPHKLLDGFGYSFYNSDFDNKKVFTTEHVRRPNGKVKVSIDLSYTIDFTARVLNFKNVFKKLPMKDRHSDSDYLYTWQTSFSADFFKKRIYLYEFLIRSVYDSPQHIFAIVPIIRTSKMEISFRALPYVVIISGIISILLYALDCSRISAGKFRMFDLVRIILGQSISHEPQKTVNRIILLTITVATVKIMNDFLLDIISNLIKQEEMPFETYKDLCDSSLKTYTDVFRFKGLKTTDNPDLLQIVDLTELRSYGIHNCFDTLTKWKNVSCIISSTDPEKELSQLDTSDLSPTMKIAQPPLVEGMRKFFCFGYYSPYALKFLKIMQRIEEANLLRWETLGYENPKVSPHPRVFDVKEPKRSTNVGVKLEQLLMILSFGFAASIIVFIIEMISKNYFDR